MCRFDGERLAELRKDKKLTQKQLAEILGVTWQTISLYENNNISPSDEVKIAIAKYFNISLDYLFCLTDQELTLDKEYLTSDHYVRLPKGYPQEMKEELLSLLDLLKIKYQLKEK